MTLGAISLYRESGLAVMAGATGFALSHLSHGHPFAATIREDLGVTIGAFVCSGVEIMAEVANNRAAAVFEGQVSWLVANVALVAVAG